MNYRHFQKKLKFKVEINRKKIYEHFTPFEPRVYKSRI